MGKSVWDSSTYAIISNSKGVYDKHEIFDGTGNGSGLFKIKIKLTNGSDYIKELTSDVFGISQPVI